MASPGYTKQERADFYAAAARATTYLPDLQADVAEMTGVTMADLTAQPACRRRTVVRARRIVIHVLREAGLSHLAVASLLGVDNKTARLSAIYAEGQPYLRRAAAPLVAKYATTETLAGVR